MIGIIVLIGATVGLVIFVLKRFVKIKSVFSFFVLLSYNRLLSALKIYATLVYLSTNEFSSRLGPIMTINICL